MGSDKATAKGSLLGAWLPKEHITRVAKYPTQQPTLKMADMESQAGSPPVVVPNSTEQSLRDRFELILMISEVAAASLAEQVMEVFTEKEELSSSPIPVAAPLQGGTSKRPYTPSLGMKVADKLSPLTPGRGSTASPSRCARDRHSRRRAAGRARCTRRCARDRACRRAASVQGE